MNDLISEYQQYQEATVDEDFEVEEGLATYEQGGYADGKPAELIASFLSRHLAGVEQAPPEKPSNAKEWVVVTAPTSEAAIRLDEPGAPEPNPEAPGDPSLLCAGACAV